MNQSKNKAYILYASLFIVLTGIGGVYYFFEIQDTLAVIKSERVEKTEFQHLQQKQIHVQVESLSNILAHSDQYVVIDVREKEEFSQGRIRNSLNYRLGEIFNEEKIRQEIIEKTKGKKRVFYCHDGERSMIAAQTIEAEFGGDNIVLRKGYQQIRNNKNSHTIWEGSLIHLLPNDQKDHRRLWLRKKNVHVNTLVDLSFRTHESVPGLEGKHFLPAPILLMSNQQIDQLIQSLGDEPVIALCNSKVSCFSTRILRYRLEERGLSLAGFVRLKEMM